MNDKVLVRLIPVERIRVVNPRTRDAQKFEQIVDNIAKLGLKKPITVAPGKPAEDGGETFDLVCGQGRLEAFVALGQREIPAIVRGLSKTDGLLVGLVENIARRRIRSLDQVRLIQWMSQQGQGCGEIAGKTGLNEEYVKDILAMLPDSRSAVRRAAPSWRARNPSRYHQPQSGLDSDQGRPFEAVAGGAQGRCVAACGAVASPVVSRRFRRSVLRHNRLIYNTLFSVASPRGFEP